MNSPNTQPNSGMILKILLPLLILAIGSGGAWLLWKLKSPPEQQPPEFRGVLVEVSELRSGPHQVWIHATGTVQTDQEIALVPEVSGKVAWLSSKMVNGGFFQTGELLLKIEADDYRLAVEKARAEVARAEVALASEQERARVARLEWERIDLPDKGEPGPLVTREIQLRQEQANLAAARAGLQQAELNLQRTEIRAPFNGRIRQESVDLGQYLRAGTAIGQLAGTDRAEILTPLPVDDLPWLKIPRTGSDLPGAAARVRLPGRADFSWQGQLVRSLGEIDPDSRMATLVVSVNDPYQFQTADSDHSLVNGRFVELNLQGPLLPEVIEIPRSALRENDSIWIMAEDNRLQILPVEVLRREPELVVGKAELADGAKLVLTPISGAVEGLLLRTAEDGDSP
jgi:RND family efflux transporter MFP subunit